MQKLSEYINKDIAEALRNNSSQISQIKDNNENILSAIIEEKGSIEQLTNSYLESNKLLKKVVESNDVNIEYIFDILDRWAEDRKIKIKK